MDEKAKFEQACKHFDAGEYFEAHDLWEELWLEASGPRHAYLQGLIQTAVSLYHSQNENWKGTRKLAASAFDYLQRGAEEAFEVDVEKLRDLLLDFDIVLKRKLLGENVELPYFKLPLK